MNDKQFDRSDPASNHPSFAWQRVLYPMTGGPDSEVALRRAMDHSAYPLSSAYSPSWTCGNSMGPFAMWLAEELAPEMLFEPDRRVLDLGCGAAVTSIFLAREYGVRVWAADLWIDPDDNAARIDEAGCSDMVTPLRAEAHALPFAHGWFDAIVSIDAYQYFGTDVRYLSYLGQFLKPGGRIGVAVPGNATDPDEPGAIPPPPELAESLGADWYAWRSAEWWRRHWSRTLCVDVELAEMVASGRESWLRHSNAIEAYSPELADFFADRPMLETDAGKSLGFCKLVARRNDKPSLHFGPGEFATRLA